jgi:co-chaperonin GroES (HSP10)
MSKLEPCGQRIIVRRLSKNETRSGLIMPDEAKRGTFVGQVVAAGPEADWVAVGDRVMFGKYSGWEFPIDREILGAEYQDCLVMNCEDVLSKVIDKTEEQK